MSKVLVAFYSQTGNTKKLANEIAEKANADTFEITVPTGTFPDDMFKTSDVAQEQKKTGNLPKLASSVPNLSQYDALVVAGPNWSASLSTPVLVFLKNIQDYTGKVISVDTSVGQNDNKYNDDFRKQAGKLNVVATVNNDANKVTSLLQ